jgi:anaerobic magnesium-protoporphyrin IX monomethyl ester cyclase
MTSVAPVQWIPSANAAPVKSDAAPKARTEKATDVLMIFPKLGTWDDIIRDIPLSVIYASTESVKRGYNVKAVDLRFYEEDWKSAIDPILQAGCRLVGLSVMTGNPVRTSLEVSKYIRENYPDVPIVWGGPHPTTLPEQTLENPYIDYVIRDGGSQPLAELLDYLRGGDQPVEAIAGLAYKNEQGDIVVNPPQKTFEILNFRDIPYHLVDISGKNYNRLNSGELVFPIFMSAGCPYQCSFCVSPAMYRKIDGKKWVGYDAQEVLEHIQYLSERYEFPRIQVYDDESFINPHLMKEIMEGWIERGFHEKFKLDFRGIRFNDIERKEIDDDYMRLMEKVGVEFMFIGLESGSPRMLKVLKKAITIDQVLKANRKLARFPKLKPHYNFFCGAPGETVESLKETKALLLQLMEENPTVYVGHGGHWKPIPGSEITNTAVTKYGLKLPDKLEGWADIDTLDMDKQAPDYPWYSKELLDMIKLLTMAGMILDGKTKDLIGNLQPVMSSTVHFLIKMYRPLLRLRLKYDYAGFFVEMKAYNFAINSIGKFLKHKFNRKALQAASAASSSNGQWTRSQAGEAQARN